MTDPLSSVSLAIAAGGGRVDGIEARQLVAAGVALLQRSAAVVRALRGRRAAILLPTSPQFLTALAACEGRGAVLVNPLAAPPEIVHQIDDADVGAVFTIEALAARIPAHVPRVLLDDAPRSARVLVGDSATDVALTSPFALDLVGDTDSPGLDEEAAIVYTSAMEGRPLGAILTHQNLLANARATIDAAAIAPDDHALAVLPFAHLFGLVVSGIAPLLAGGRVTTVPRFNPLRVAERLVEGDVTTLVAVPSVFASVLAALERRDTPASFGALRLCICGGAPLAVALQERWAAVTGVELRQGYGLTEAGPVCLFNRVDRANVRGTMGVPFPGVSVEVRDQSSDALVPSGTEGELCVHGPNVSPGYVSGGEKGLAHTGDGWLRTGDLAAARDDGTFEFRGLCKPMFTRNGFNIYPREISLAVMAMPGVHAVRVRQVPEPAKENDIALDVRADAGITEDDVKQWCASRLSAYKQPTIVQLTSSS